MFPRVRILGIDPGSHNTGWGVVDRQGSTFRRVASGVIRTRGGSLPERLARIHTELTGVIDRHGPSVAALEAVFTHRNPRSALLLGHARGAALAACGAAGLAAAEYAPARIKRAVSGYGQASKPQVAKMVTRLLALRDSLADDEADALAVGICHCLEQRRPLANELRA